MRISDWSSDVCSSDLDDISAPLADHGRGLDLLEHDQPEYLCDRAPGVRGALEPDRQLQSPEESRRHAASVSLRQCEQGDGDDRFLQSLPVARGKRPGEIPRPAERKSGVEGTRES